MLCNLGAQNLTDTFDVDYDTFLSEEFDANIYASAIIEESESSTDATDIGTELSKLAFSIDIVNKQIQEQVSFSSLKYGALKGIHINGCHRLWQITKHSWAKLQASKNWKQCWILCNQISVVSITRFRRKRIILFDVCIH